MSDTAIAALNNRIEALTRELSDARSEAKQRRLASKKLTTELEQLRSQVTTLTRERDDFKTKAETNPTELQKKLDDALGTIRNRNHRDALAKLYEDKDLDLSKSVPIDSLLKLLDYKAEGDAPDLAAVKAKVKEAQAAHPFLKGQHGSDSQNAPGGQPTGKPQLDTGMGDAGSRGGRDTTTRQLTVRKSDMQDPTFMRQHQKAIAEASAAGSLNIVE